VKDKSQLELDRLRAELSAARNALAQYARSSSWAHGVAGFRSTLHKPWAPAAKALGMDPSRPPTDLEVVMRLSELERNGVSRG